MDEIWRPRGMAGNGQDSRQRQQNWWARQNATGVAGAFIVVVDTRGSESRPGTGPEVVRVDRPDAGTVEWAPGRGFRVRVLA